MTKASVHQVLVGSAGLCITLGLPAVAAAKGPENDETVAAAKASKLFKRELKRDQLQAAGLGQITLSPGVQLDVQGFVQATALDARPEITPLLDPKLPAGLLRGAPIYREAILELEDRLVVDRKLTIDLAPGACARADKPAAIADLCFTRNPAKKQTKAKNADLVAIRAKLAKSAPETIVRGTVTAAQASSMTDEELFDLLINTGARTIHQISVVPRLNIKADAVDVAGLRGFGGKLVAAAVDPGLVVQLPANPGPKLNPADVMGGASKTFPREYFLTGFTYGREIEDSWEYTFADSTWLTDRYYVRIEYHLGLGFGVRAPFSVDVKATSSGTDTRRVELAVAPVNVDTTGAPAYQAVGLPGNKTFDGREFVLEFKAGCRLYVSIPGPNIDKKCPTLDLSYSRDINPVIGNESSNIGDWWLDGNVTGLALSLAAASVSLDVGLGADVTNGVIGMRASALPGSGFSGWSAGTFALNNRNPLVFTATRTPGTTTAGFRLDQPTYGFDIRVMPKLRAKVKVDVAVYEKTWTLGPWNLGFLSIARNFQLSHHAGTVALHDYPLFNFGNADQALDPGAGQPQPPPKPPKKKFDQAIPPKGSLFEK